MPRKLHQRPNNDPIRFGYEKIGDKEYKVYNHTNLIGYYIKTSIRYFRGYSLDKELIASSDKLETVCMGLLLAQERSQ